MSANALVAGAFFVLLFENLEPKVLFLRERIIPSRSVELHMWSRALTDRIWVC